MLRMYHVKVSEEKAFIRVHRVMSFLQCGVLYKISCRLSIVFISETAHFRANLTNKLSEKQKMLFLVYLYTKIWEDRIKDETVMYVL